MSAEARQLKIKTGVVKRLAKEITMYQKEAEKQQARIQNLIDTGADEHDVRKQKEVLQESLVMIPDTQRRLQEAFADLEEFTQTVTDLKETPEFEAASAILEEARPQLSAEY
ncbi:tubulin binding cofactor A [Catenaria anguillulae PL171]|uniref:Tubulin-specific chaperone A n=1 Tax=Catenaria anguillulae PL171 TaxID=765915 RepID=A0A1Y2HE99_9FUNG|nr:tubulin binding cofactor A [Catenaria anguillulae PL171]